MSDDTPKINWEHPIEEMTIKLKEAKLNGKFAEDAGNHNEGNLWHEKELAFRASIQIMREKQDADVA